MHSYDPSRQPYQSQIPSMRPARDGSAGQSATPIYDALYSEYRRAFRALPGDRSGEEHLGFKAFGAGPHGSRVGSFGHGSHTGHSTQGNWVPYQAGRPHSPHQPAALPPAPRREL
ncbi:hypothetical protein [Streptomyces sp. NPDC002889]|uniref:hypothetical protein n=1 Tax=Streptomyces sp. NPDC002889 TaxID=3364669 RepID=UPI0036C810DB